MTAENPYSMTIDLNVLNHLGIGLYSSTPAVISEIVANSWDADATCVKIDIRPQTQEIEIVDDGIGMTQEDINNKYLRVGYQKRKVDGSVTPGKRHVMGRKGIGKLSVFSIARFVEVHTVKDGARSGLVMDRTEIQKLMGAERPGVYHPETVPDDEISVNKGTRILLREFDKGISSSEVYLRKRLARRFSVIGPRNGFEVVLNGSPISAGDRDFYSKLEFLWHLGEEGAEVKKHSSCYASEIIDGEIGTIEDSDKNQIKLFVNGWVGTVDRPETIDKTNNAVVIMSHGKLVHENVLPDFREAGVYADYVIGEINADFLDADDLDDIVTSGRQSVKENDPRFELLVTYVGKVLKKIKTRWTDLRKKRGTQKALENAVLRQWFETLSGDRRKTAETLFGKIEALRLGDQQAKAEIYRSSLLAFEKLSIRDTLSSLDEIESERDFRALTRVSATVDEIEAVLYHDIVRGRLAVIKKFINLAPSALENVLRDFIFEHLWLLDASWERAATKAQVEQAVTTEFGKVKLSEDEKKGRIDLRYRTAAGKHIIVELKKYSVPVKATALCSQVQKYRSALLKCLKDQFPNEPTNIEAICLLGKAPTPRDQPEENREMLKALGARWYTYDQLLEDTRRSYQEFLEQESKVRTIVRLLDNLENSL